MSDKLPAVVAVALELYRRSDIEQVMTVEGLRQRHLQLKRAMDETDRVAAEIREKQINEERK